jgi:hypothetical protein
MPFADPEKLSQHKKEYYLKNREAKKLYMAEYYLKNKEARKIFQLEKYHNNPSRTRLSTLRYRAKRTGLAFNLEEEDIIFPDYCPILGLPLIISGTGHNPNNVSVDRIIPALGYVKGNIQFISYRANTMKSDASPEELVLFAKWVKRTYPELYGMD